PPMRPGTKHVGPHEGKVCTNAGSPQEAAAAGCRWLGSKDGYDLCANPNWYRLPQCVAREPDQRDQTRQAAVFTYFYVNGINTPRTNADWRGSCASETNLVAENLLDLPPVDLAAPRAPKHGPGLPPVRVANESDRMYG